MVFIHPDPVTHIQKIYELSPRHWRNIKENIPSLICQFEQQLIANIFLAVLAQDSIPCP